MCNTYLDPEESLSHRNVSGYIYVRTRIAGLCSILTPTSLQSVSEAFSMSLNCSESTSKIEGRLCRDFKALAFGYRLYMAVIAVESALYGESHVCFHPICILHWRWACFVETSFVGGIIRHISIYPLVRQRRFNSPRLGLNYFSNISTKGVRTRTSVLLLIMTSLMFMVSTIHYMTTWITAEAYRDDRQLGVSVALARSDQADLSVRKEVVVYILEQMLPFINVRGLWLRVSLTV